jgi:hypothetical protein
VNSSRTPSHTAPGPAAAAPGQENLRLRLRRGTREVICAVLDPSYTVPVLKAPGYAAHSGRGLQMVDGLSDVWGWSPIAGWVRLCGGSCRAAWPSRWAVGWTIRSQHLCLRY